MIRTVPFDATANFNWDVLALSDAAKIRPERRADLFAIPTTGELVGARLALRTTSGSYPTSGGVAGAVHSASFPLVSLPARRAFIALWIPVDHVPAATKPTEVTVRLSDGVLDYTWNGSQWVPATGTTWTSVASAQANVASWSTAGAPGADTTKIQIKVRLRTEDKKTTPACFGFRLGVHVDFGVKVQAAGGAAHPVASSWVDAAVHRAILPAMGALDFRWWGQVALATGADRVSVADVVGQTSMTVDSILAAYQAGTAGAGLGAAIAGAWNAGASAFVFNAALGAATEVLAEVSLIPNTRTRPHQDLVSRSLPHILAQNVRWDHEEPPDIIKIPDLAALVVRQWRRRRYRLRLDLRIEAHDLALCRHISETLHEWLDGEGGRVVTCPVTGYGYSVSEDGPPRSGAEIGYPQIIMPIRVFAIPHFEALTDLKMVNPSGASGITVTGDPAVPG